MISRYLSPLLSILIGAVLFSVLASCATQYERASSENDSHISFSRSKSLISISEKVNVSKCSNFECTKSSNIILLKGGTSESASKEVRFPFEAGKLLVIQMSIAPNNPLLYRYYKNCTYTIEFTPQQRKIYHFIFEALPRGCDIKVELFDDASKKRSVIKSEFLKTNMKKVKYK